MTNKRRMKARRSRKGSQYGRSAAQHLVHRFAVLINSNNVDKVVTASQFGIPKTRPARPRHLRLEYFHQVDQPSGANNAWLFSVSCKTGTGEVDTRTRQIISSPVVRSFNLRIPAITDFDHYSAAETVVSINAAVIGGSGTKVSALFLNFALTVEYKDENIQSVTYMTDDGDITVPISSGPPISPSSSLSMIDS